MRIAIAMLTGIGAHHVAHIAHIHGTAGLVVGAVAAFIAYDRIRR